MNFRITGRFILTVAGIITTIIIINIVAGLAFLALQLTSDINLEEEDAYMSTESYTLEFSKELSMVGDHITLSEKGMQMLTEREGWIQVINSEGMEVFNAYKPESVENSYTPFDLIQTYKYGTQGGESTIFISKVELLDETYSYLVGLPMSHIKKYIVSYESETLKNALTKGIQAVLLIDIPFALLLAYLASRGLTKPLVEIVEDVRTLSGGAFTVIREEKGLYKDIYRSINNLALVLKNNKEEVKKTEAMREDWISNISHDIKTPLVSIKGYAEILADEDYALSTKEIVQYAEIIEDKSNYINDLVEDLNLSARLKNNALSLNLEETNMVSLIRTAVIDILNNPLYENMEIEFTSSEEKINHTVDKVLIKRVVTNLLYNAIVHNDENVKIEVSVRKEKNIHINIKDNGKGIALEEQKHIFDRYYRGTNTSVKHKGSGLGMAIAYDAIKAHGGEIKLESTLGQGTNVEIVL